MRIDWVAEGAFKRVASEPSALLCRACAAGQGLDRGSGFTGWKVGAVPWEAAWDLARFLEYRFHNTTFNAFRQNIPVPAAYP